MAFTSIESFSEIAHKYDGFILDQYGVMHNGSESLPGSVACIEKLASMGKKLIILSNTSSPSEMALKKLPKFGFDKHDFIGAVTSGEEAAAYIKSKYGATSSKKKAIFFAWEKKDISMAFLKKCGNIEATTNVAEADFVITLGCDVLHDSSGSGTKSLGSYMHEGDFSVIDPILEQSLERDLPIVCANPDLIAKLAGGVTANMPGQIAEKYEEMGGKCKYFGKPYAEHFEACLDELGLEPSRVCHVGDSLHHDIKGANAAKVSSVFITGGVHCDAFDCDVGELPEKNELKDLFDKEGIQPTHVSPMLKFHA